MPKRVEFLKDCMVRTVLGDNGRFPRAVTEYKAGQTALIPEHHYEQAVAQGAVANDEGQGGTSGEAEKNPRRAKKSDAPSA